MSKQAKMKTAFPVFGSLAGLCFAGILTAMSIVLGKFLQIPNPFQEFIRISFENLPIILAGFSLGPIAGLVVGLVSDLIGCLLYGYAINWRITLGAAAVGAVSGTVSALVKKPELLRIILSVSSAHLVGSVLIKSWGLAKWYLASYDIGYWEFVLWRLLNYSLIATAECVIICLLFKNSAFRKQIERMVRK
jgi:ECF transporter S component (folate family)